MEVPRYLRYHVPILAIPLERRERENDVAPVIQQGCRDPKNYRQANTRKRRFLRDYNTKGKYPH